MQNNEKLVFVALGGLEEIGLNCYLYGIRKGDITNYIMVDLGLGFKDSKFKFLDTFIPDLQIFKNPNNKLDAIVFTHGHEDHIGALKYHLPDLQNVPMYATPLTAELIRNKLQMKTEKATLIEVESGKKYAIGKFDITFIEELHSIPEPNMILIDSKFGLVVHSGDFKINLEEFDAKKLLPYFKNPPRYLFCDSTNAVNNNPSLSEESIIPDLTYIVQNSTQAVWVTLFSSNIERMNNILRIADDCDRKVVLLGTAVKNYYAVGKKYKYINNFNIIGEEEIENYPPEQLLYIITGSQGEERSFLHNLLFQNSNIHNLKIKKNDTFIFSSRIIPGNENNVGKLYNALAKLDVNLYISDHYNIHVSGHPSSTELLTFYKTLNPSWVIPIHGEMLHMKTQEKLAKQYGIKSKVFINGQVIDLTGEIPEIIEEIPVNKLYNESGRNLPITSDIFKQRKKVMYEGLINLSLIINRKALPEDIRINFVGLLTEEERNSFTLEIKRAIKLSLNELTKSAITNIEEVQKVIKKIIKNLFINTLQKKPLINIDIFYS